MDKPHPVKKLIALAWALIVSCIPFLLHFQITSQSFVKYFFVITTNEGLVCTLFAMGIALLLIGLLLKKIPTKK